MLIMYMSAIFYTTDAFSEGARGLFYLNPLYVYITYIREVVIGGQIPSGSVHILAAAYAALALLIGTLIYKTMRYKFIYYV